MKLGINVDHVATLRNARGTRYPDPLLVAIACERAGCDSIVAHLREDRRHIRERDVLLIKQAVKILFNLEMSINPGVVKFALKLKPAQATLVPEKRRELTTEGGLDLIKDYKKVAAAVKRLQDNGTKVSLFVDPTERQIELSKKMAADLVEINTGRFAEAKTAIIQARELSRIKNAAKYAKEAGFFVAAGHGIDYQNVKKIVTVKEIEELNIGHSIICHAIYVGIASSVKTMMSLIER